MEKSSTAFVGMDVHKESIDIAIADAREARHFGRIAGDAAAVDRVIRKLRSVHKKPLFVYEAGPCGFWLYRKLTAQGLPCMVVSPSLTPRNAADRVKTDRRDAMKLARLARAGELEPIYVPDALDEAIRDLVRTREDAVAMQRQARQRLQALLLRNEIRYVGKCAWTQAHRRWISGLKLPNPAQQIAFEEYVQAVHEAGARLERLGASILAQLEHWRWRPVVEALQALRGVQAIHAVRIVAELGDFQRFESPRKLMAYLGLIPSEDSSGPRRRQGSITKAGNSSARRALVEAAWAYAHPARVSWVIARAPDQALEERLRHRLEGSASLVRAVSQTCRPRAAEEQGGGRNRARTLRVHLGDRAAGKAGFLIRENAHPAKEALAHTTGTHLTASVARPRLENPRRNVIDPAAMPASQILERGSSVTYYSLALPNARISA